MAQSVSSLMSSVPHTLLVGSLLQWQYQFIILIANHLQTLGQKSQRIQSQKLVITPVIHYSRHCSETTALAVSCTSLQSSDILLPAVSLQQSLSLFMLLHTYKRGNTPHCGTPTGALSIKQVLQHQYKSIKFSYSELERYVFTFLFCSHHSMYRLRFFGLQARRIHSVWFK